MTEHCNWKISMHNKTLLKPYIFASFESVIFNYAKRDRISISDIDKIIEIENRTRIYPASWYAKDIWEHIKANYQANPTKITGVYRDALKQNMTNFMHLLYVIIKNTGETGKELLAEFVGKPK